VEKDLADALLDFYQKILKPEFDVIKEKLSEHGERFSEVMGHLESIYNRLGSLEDEYLMINNRLKRIEESIESGNSKRSDLEKRVKDMKEHLANLQSRLELVEGQLSK
jgi:predicted nuclease with TOPRIM domain